MTDGPTWAASDRIFPTRHPLTPEITATKNEGRIGQIEKVLVEGESRNDPEFLSGRTDHNRILNFRGTKDLVGKIVDVKVTEGLLNSLRGELVV